MAKMCVIQKLRGRQGGREDDGKEPARSVEEGEGRRRVAEGILVKQRHRNVGGTGREG